MSQIDATAAVQPFVPMPSRLIARVAVDMPLAHLDRVFDYEVPEKLDAEAQPGVRVKVRFAGRAADGFIIERTDVTDAERLASIEKVVSPEQVLTSAQVRLLRAVADHWSGTFADVVRLAIPPRHAATEKANQREWKKPEPPEVPGGMLTAQGGERFSAALAAGESPRAFWQVPPVFGDYANLPTGIAQAVSAALSSDRGSIIIAPTVKDVDRLHAQLEEALGKGTVAVLHNDLGPAARYRNYLAILRGQARIVVGARAAAYAPMANLGLMALIDDGDDNHAEPRAPYPHARDVVALRVAQERCGLLFASYGRTAEIEAWVERGWLVALTTPTPDLRRHCPAVKAAGDSDFALSRDPHARSVRIPKLAFDTITRGLTSGPVLVHVARQGYLVALACQTCRTPASCGHCHGPLRMPRSGQGPGAQTLTCGWCGRPDASWSCTVCGGTTLRSPVVGAERTAEELGKAFPQTRIIDSSRGNVIDEVGSEPAIVIATTGAEPQPETGYASAVILDAGLELLRQDLRAGEESIRRWLAVTALVRPPDQGGTVCIVGPSDDRAVQALVRLDPGTFAARELDDRRGAGFSPAAKVIAIDGTPVAVSNVLATIEDFRLDRAHLDTPEFEILGPVDLPARAGAVGGERDDLQRVILRTPVRHGSELVLAVRQALSARSARKDPPVRVTVDPQLVL